MPSISTEVDLELTLLQRLAWRRSKMKVSTHTARLTTRLARARDIDDLLH